MASPSLLSKIAAAYLARERQRTGAAQADQAATASADASMLRRAQAQRIAQELELAPAQHEAEIELRGAQARLADANAVDATAQAATRGVPKPPDVGSFEDYVTQKYGARPTPDQIAEARGVYGRADDRPINVGITPTAESNILNRLVAQWDKAIAPARELSRQAKIMETGLNAARRGNLASGSQAVLVTFQKILDPTSVVRESEYARSAAGQALLARIQGAFERLEKGGAGVPLAELEKFAALANEMVNASVGDYTRAVQERIGRTADHYKIRRDLVFEDYDFGARPNAPPAGEVSDLPGGGWNQGAADRAVAPAGSPQTRIINGVTYVKVPGGWQRQK